MNPSEDVSDYIRKNLPVRYVGVGVFAGKLRAPSDLCPARSVFCRASGGPAPGSYADGGSGTNEHFPQVNIRIRSNPRDYKGGEELARSVRDTIHEAAIDGYHYVRVLESEPLYVDEDDEGHHEWSVTVQLEFNA